MASYKNFLDKYFGYTYSGTVAYRFWRAIAYILCDLVIIITKPPNIFSYFS